MHLLSRAFFEWVYSRERSFEGFLEGSRSTRTLMVDLAVSFFALSFVNEIMIPSIQSVLFNHV